jgi:hypothetical protein
VRTPLCRTVEIQLLPSCRLLHTFLKKGFERSNRNHKCLNPFLEREYPFISISYTKKI